MTGQSDSAEKSFEATPQKLEKARKQGEVPKSADLNAAASYLGLIIAFIVVAPWAISNLGETLSKVILDADQISKESFGVSGRPLLSNLLLELSNSLFGIFFLPILAVLISLTGQQAWTFSITKIQPKLARVSPISGIKNKFGLNGIFEFLKSTFKLIIVVLLLVWLARRDVELLVTSVSLSVGQISIIMVDLILRFLFLIFLMSLAIGGIDYLWQMSSHLRKNRMTRKEVEDETKTTEGDPHHKQTRKQRGYEIAMNQMLSEVPKASVVVVNPTHFAVALQWDHFSIGAPVCVAKGVDHVAARIRETAEASNVPIFSDPPITRAIYASVEIGAQILPEHYKAVAVAIRFSEDMRKKATQR